MMEMSGGRVLFLSLPSPIPLCMCEGMRGGGGNREDNYPRRFLVRKIGFSGSSVIDLFLSLSAALEKIIGVELKRTGHCQREELSRLVVLEVHSLFRPS